MGSHRAYMHNRPAEYFQHLPTLLRSASELRGTMADISGWVVEAIVPAVGTTLVRRRYLFAVSSDNASEAERLVRQRLGSLHCAIAVRLRLEPRAIADLQMGSNPIKELAR
jgi:hypothetical protein